MRAFPALVVGVLAVVPLDGLKVEESSSGSSGWGDFSAFQNVVLVLQGVRADRLDLMYTYYKPLFQDVVFMYWAQENKTQLTTLNGQSFKLTIPQHKQTFFAAVPAKKTKDDATVIECADRYHYHTKCLGPFLEELSKKSPLTKGLLTCHMDFWFRPSTFLDQQQMDKIWMLGPGLTRDDGLPEPLLGPHCFNDKQGLMADKAWWWTAKLKNQAWSAGLSAQHSLLGLKADHTEVCAGWADMFYLPRATWASFSKLSSFYSAVHHEVAIPTMLRSMVRLGKVPARKDLDCWGGCCSDVTAHTSLITGKMCGHPMDMRVQAIQYTWSQMLRTDQKFAELHTREWSKTGEDM